MIKASFVPGADRGVSSQFWSDWRWQLSHAIRTAEELEHWIKPTVAELRAVESVKGRYRWQITPYYASLMDRTDPTCPVRQQAVPSLKELEISSKDSVDPVGDQKYRVTNRLIHKYPDRVALLVTELCPVYCRHCTRKYHTTDLNGSYFERGEQVPFDEDIEYIRSDKRIRDVLLTGGDPLMYSDRRLRSLISSIRQIPHVGVIRLGTRFPVLLPQRITEEFCDLLAEFHPIWVNTHFNHPKELTSEAVAACSRLQSRGIPVQNQSVLLKGINDRTEILDELFSELIKARIRPYYLYHCDDVAGVSHFRTSLRRGRQLMDELYGRVAGFALPRYVVTTLGGKIPAERECLSEDAGGFAARSYTGDVLRLKDEL